MPIKTEPEMKPTLSPRQRAIDRGPAWIAAIISCVIMAMHYGILNCGSLYYPSWMDTTGYPIGVVSWLVTGQFAIAFCLAPLYSRLLEKIPNRIGAVVGTFVTSGAIIISTFANNFFVFMVPYTIVGGIGLGFTVIPVLGILAEYFDRYRVLALALAASGAGFGTFIFSKLDAFLIDTYTWRMALIAQALLHLNVIPLRMLLRPLARDPVPEPTILVPDHPDLTQCEVPGLKLDQPRPTEMGASNMLLSLLSVNSVRSAGGGSRFRAGGLGDEPVRRVRPNQDLRVVIEYVRITCLPNQRDTFTVGPINFLSSPGPGVMEQLENEAREYFAQADPSIDTVLIPIMFVLGENDAVAAAAISGSRRALDVHESSEYIGSRYDLGSTADVGEFSQVYRQVVVGDAFTSSMVAKHDRKQLRKNINEVIVRGQKSIENANKQLLDRGLAVCPNTVTALIDQSDYFAPPSNVTNFGSDDRVCVLGYYGPDDATIPEEVEPEDGAMESNTIHPTEMSLMGDQSQKVDKSRPLHQSSQMLAPSSRSHRFSVASRGRGTNILGSISQLSKVDKYGEVCYRSRDVFASVISVNTVQEAADLLTSKLKDEANLELLAPTTQYRSLPKILIADPLLLAFLLSRALAFITDSVMYAHLSNFGLELGFDSDRAASLLSFVGVTAMLGRLCMGFVGQFFERMDIQGTSAICLLLVSVCVALLPVFNTYNAMSASCIIYGVLVSPSFAFAPGITFQLVGPQRYDEAVSYLFQFEALGFLIGGPVGGFIKGIKNRYLDCFLFAAVSDFCSGFILALQTLLASKLWLRATRLCRKSDTDAEAADSEIDKSECSEHEFAYNSGDPSSWKYYGSAGSVRATS